MKCTFFPDNLIDDTRLSGNAVIIWGYFAQTVKGEKCQEVANKARKDIKTVRRAVDQLVAYGYLEKQKQGTGYIYSVPEKYRYSENGNVCAY